MLFRSHKPVYFFYILASFCMLSCRTTAQTKSTYNLVTDFGAVGDNKTNNYQALKKAAATLSGSVNKTLIIPNGNYYIADYKISDGIRKNTISDINFKNIKGLKIEGNNSTIRVNGKFKRAADASIAGTTFKYAFNNTVCPLYFSGSSNISLKNIHLLGGANEMEKDEGVVEGVCYGIMIMDKTPAEISSNFVIENVTASYFATDALYISNSGKNIAINNVQFTKNGRQGISIVKGRDIVITNSSFDSTGFTGKYGQHSPAAGIDVENENDLNEVDNIKVSNCIFRHNKGLQFVSSARSGRVTIDSCYFEDLTGGYGNGFNSVGIFSRNSGISNSIIYGMMQLETAQETYRGNAPIYIKNNIIYSGMCGLLSSDYSTPMDITGNILIMLPKPVPEQFFPLIRNQNANFSSNIIITHEDKFTVQKSRITGLIEHVKNTENNWWLLSETYNNGLKISDKNITEFYQTSFYGSAKKGIQYYPAKARLNSAARNDQKYLDEKVLATIFNNNILRNYNQYKFDKTLISEAAQIRALLFKYQ